MGTGTTTQVTDAGAGLRSDGFARVVCGVDGRRLGFEAARQAARLTSAEGRLTLVGVIEPFAALAGRWGDEPSRRRPTMAPLDPAGRGAAELTDRARASLAWAESQAAGPAELGSRVVEGEVHRGLLAVVGDEEAGLVVVGAHGGHRLVAAALADGAALVLHEAPCSVLVARHGYDPDRFPARIVVGVDGSPESQAALAAAAALRRRSGGALTVVTAGHHQAEAVAALDGFDAPHVHVATPDRPVDALVTAARSADLAIVGSRGLSRAAALGSVSERVAFRAESSVLVVRPGPGFGKSAGDVAAAPDAGAEPAAGR
ncbi:MAG: universal stress protein [Thermoleophilia bacterium]